MQQSNIYQQFQQEAPFTYDWFLKLHIEMFGNVWDWAGKPRQIKENFNWNKSISLFLWN